MVWDMHVILIPSTHLLFSSRMNIIWGLLTPGHLKNERTRSFDMLELKFKQMTCIYKKNQISTIFSYFLLIQFFSWLSSKLLEYELNQISC